MDLFKNPAFQPTMMHALGMLAGGAPPSQVIANGALMFAQSEHGKVLGAKAMNAMTPMLDTLVKQPFLATHWGALTKVAAEPGKISGLVTKALGSTFGTKGTAAAATFVEKLLGTATTKGFGEAIKFGSKAAPGLLKILGKFAKFLPGVGLATSLFMALKTFADPSKTGAQKMAALLDIGAGVVGLIPGLGTGAQIAIAAGSTAVGLAADAGGGKKKGWTAA